MMMKELDFDLKDSPFSNFFTSRCSISARINVKNVLNFCNEKNLSFFVLSLGCLLSGLNSVPELRRRILNGKAIEFDKLDAIVPIMDKDESIFEEMRVSPPKKSESLKEWHDRVINLRDSILNGNKQGFSLEITKRDIEPIGNFSCIPWVDFDTLSNCILEPHQVQPLITWGKVSNNKMSVAIAFNHIFVYGRQIGHFYDNVQEYFNNPETISKNGNM